MDTNTKVLEAGNLNATFPLPAKLDYQVGDKKFRFCKHCHTPKPVAQVPAKTGVCVNCANGINNYDRLAAAGLVAPRPGTKLVPYQMVKLAKVVVDGAGTPAPAPAAASAKK